MQNATQTHPRRQVTPAPAFHADRYVPGPEGTVGLGHLIPTLKHMTPIVGDTIVYETETGDVLTSEQARKRLDEGSTLFYTTWEL